MDTGLQAVTSGALYYAKRAVESERPSQLVSDETEKAK